MFQEWLEAASGLIEVQKPSNCNLLFTALSRKALVAPNVKISLQVGYGGVSKTVHRFALKRVLPFTLFANAVVAQFIRDRRMA